MGDRGGAAHIPIVTITRTVHPRRAALLLGAFTVLSVAGCTAHVSPPVTAPASSGTLAGTGIRTVSSPGHVTDDVTVGAGQCHIRVVNAAAGTSLPDPACTPGAVDPAVTQATLPQTICRSGWTDTVRPPTSETGRAKAASLRQYGQPAAATTEYDHLISLQLGGANTTSNLWPEPNADGARGTTNPKDAVENRLHSAVCAGTITLVDAQRAIAADWTTALGAAR